MASIFQKIFLPFLLIFVSILTPFIPECTTCESTGELTCSVCHGEGYVYNEEFDVMAVCGECGSYGKIGCTNCSEIAKIFYAAREEIKK